MTLYMFDAAYSPSLAAVKRAGGVAMNGYLTGRYASTTAQPAAVRAAGLGYVATYEEGPAELVRASRATGRRVGDKIAAAFKAKRIPLDGTVAVYPSVDVSVPIDGADHDADACNTGWQGVRDVLDGDVSLRAYAEGAVIDALTSARLVDGKCWLAAPTSWPGYRVNDVNVCAVQLVGSPVGGTDANHIVTDPSALGAWWPDGSPYGEDMALTQAQADQLARAEKYAIAACDRAQSLQGAVAAQAAALADVLKAAQHSAAQGDTVAQILGTADTGVSDRVSALQSAVAALAKTVGELGPAAVNVDTAAIVSAVNAELAKLPAAVLAQTKTLNFKAV